MTSTGATAQHIIPFRSRAKLREDLTIPPSKYDEYKIPRWNKKKQMQYALHHIHGPHTWMADYFFFHSKGKVIDASEEPDEETKPSELLTILAMMHCNSRLFVAFICRYDKKQKLPPRGGIMFRKLIEQYFITSNDMEEYVEFGRPRIDTLITDYEKAFGLDVYKIPIEDADNEKYMNKYDRKDATERFIYSDEPAGNYVYRIIRDDSGRDVNMAVLYKKRHIEHISYNTSADKGAHSKLAIIDRMARTLRDMVFNVRRVDPKFELNEVTLTKLCREYNFSTHATLSRIMGFPVSPFKAYTNMNLQNEICARTMHINYHTLTTIAKEKLHENQEVWLHKPPIFGKKRRNNVEDDPYEIVGFSGPAGFRVRNKNTGDEKTRSRMHLVVP